MSEERTFFDRGERIETSVQPKHLDAMEYRIAELELQIQDAETHREFLRKVQVMANIEVDRMRAAMENKESYLGPLWRKSIQERPSK